MLSHFSHVQLCATLWAAALYGSFITYLFDKHYVLSTIANFIVLSHFSRVQLCATLWAAALQAPPSMGILQARVLEWVAMSSSKATP